MNIAERSAPFRHWVIDGAVPAEVLAGAYNALPAADWPGWVRYANELEQKRTTRPGGRELLPAALRVLLDHLTCWPWLALLERLSGIANLSADRDDYGGGLHVADPGDYLQCHLDAAVHPRLDLDRRLVQVLWLNPDWDHDWGGETMLFDAAGRDDVCRIDPVPGRILLWEASDVSYHGAAAVTGPASRVTVATFYYAPPRGRRRRALFIPKRSA